MPIEEESEHSSLTILSSGKPVAFARSRILLLPRVSV